MQPDAVASLLAAGAPPAGPGWLDETRAAAAAAFRAAGLPTRRWEAWRYTSLAPLLGPALPLADAAANAPAPDRIAGLGGAPDSSGARLVFVNGRLRADLSRLEALPDGASLLGLNDALAADDELRAAIADDAEWSARPLLALNAALAGDGYVLRVADGVAVQDPIEIVFHATQDVAAYGRHMIALGAGARACVVEHHVGVPGVGDPGVRGLANHAVHIRLATNARLERHVAQLESAGASHLALTRADLDAGARLDAFFLSLGAALSRQEMDVKLHGDGAVAHVDGAYAGRGAQIVDHTITVDHKAPGGTSRQCFKGVLDERARGVFQGGVIVRRHAQRSDGRQMSRALLLSNRAEIDAKPQLEIHADDVRCAHGATAGELDPAALFYLRARGLDEAEARRMLVTAFLDEAFASIERPDVRDAFAAHAHAWLNAGSVRHE